MGSDFALWTEDKISCSILKAGLACTMLNSLSIKIDIYGHPVQCQGEEIFVKAHKERRNTGRISRPRIAAFSSYKNKIVC